MAKTQFSTKKQFSYKTLFGMIAALVAFFILLTSVIDLSGKYFMTRGRIKDFEVQKHELREKEFSLSEQNAYFETLEGQRQLLREKYNAVYDGEEIVIITQENNDLEINSNVKKESWWRNIIKGLGFE